LSNAQTLVKVMHRKSL